MKFTTITIALVAMILSSSAYAQSDRSMNSSVTVEPRPVQNRSEQRPHIGVFGGAALNENRGSDIYGINIGYQPYIPYGVGLEIANISIQEPISNITEDWLFLAAKGAYNFGGTQPVLKNSYVGVVAGAANRGRHALWSMAPIIGFDIPLTRNQTTDIVSLGAHARYNWIEGRDNDNTSLSGELKYWF